MFAKMKCTGFTASILTCLSSLLDSLEMQHVPLPSVLKNPEGITFGFMWFGS